MQRLTTNIVKPEGPLSAKIVFVGQAPGREEDTFLRPFIGSAGQLLNRCLRQSGIIRASVLITNVFSQRPPGNKVGYFYQDKSCTKPTWEGEEHIARLQKFLESLLKRREAGLEAPNLIVALGREAMLTLTGRKRITKWRGSVLPCTLVPGFKVYCAFHPSYVNRLINEPREVLQGEKKKQQENALPLFLIDLKRVQKQAEFPEIRYPERTFDTNLSFHEICEKLKVLASAKDGIVGVDIETLPGLSGPILWMIGFAPSPDYAFTIPILKEMRFAWSLQEEVTIFKLISEVFLNPNLTKVFQGGTYDLSVLGRYYGLRVASGSYEDTMFCHHSVYPYLRKALHTQTSIYTWEPYYKDEGKVHFGKRSSDEAEARYNCKDTTVTREILSITHREAKEFGSWDGYRRTISVIPSLLAMMLRGVRIDVEKKDKLATRFEGIAKNCTEQLKDLVGYEVNLDSKPQVMKVFYGYYGLPLQYHPKTGQPTIAKDAYKKLIRTTRIQYGEDNEILKALLIYEKYQKYSKLASTYTGMEVDSDGRIHTSYSLISTYRLNSSTSPFGSGGNLQNIPVRGEEGKAIRSLFIPDPGMVMIAGDYSKAEAMVVDWEAEDIAAINAHLSKVDVHWLRAREIFQIPESIEYKNPHNTYFTSPVLSEETNLYDLRQMGKKCKHAGNYGEGPRLLQNQLAAEGYFLTFAACKSIIQNFRVNSPFIMAWQRRIREQIKATRILVSSFGRKRGFYGRLNDSLFRAAYAFSPQNTVGEMTEVGGREINERAPFIDLLMNVHDEIVVQVPIGREEEAMKIMRECMIQPLTIKGRELIIPVDFKIGPSWGELEEV